MHEGNLGYFSRVLKSLSKIQNKLCGIGRKMSLEYCTLCWGFNTGRGMESRKEKGFALQCEKLGKSGKAGQILMAWFLQRGTYNRWKSYMVSPVTYTGTKNEWQPKKLSWVRVPSLRGWENLESRWQKSLSSLVLSLSHWLCLEWELPDWTGVGWGRALGATALGGG